MPKPPIVADLVWTHDLVFQASAGTQSITLDGNSREGLSPTQALAIALAGCMAMDVADILSRGRQRFRAIRSHLAADRAQEAPHRFLRVTLRFTVAGDVRSDAVARAIALSHDKYCSVWHSMRQDIAFTTAYDVEP